MILPLTNPLSLLNPTDMPRKMPRFELQIDPEVLETLNRASKGARLTKAEAIVAGINLLDRLVQADKEGKEIAFVPKNNRGCHGSP